MPDLSDFFNGAPFNPYSIEAQEDFAAIPAGKYLVLIEKSEVKLTKKQTGHYIYLEMQILEDGPYKGRKVFDQINIQNPSDQCVQIGMRTLAALGQALGMQEVDDSSQLLNKVVVAHVKVQEGRNCVRTYSINEEALAPVAPADPPSPVHSVAPETLTPAPTPAPAAPAPDAPVAPIAPVVPVTPEAPMTPVAPAVNTAVVPPWER